VASEEAGAVSRVDRASRTVTQQINVGTDPVALAVGHGSVWVANSQDGTVTEITAASGHPSGLISVGDGPSGVAVAPDGTIWVADQLSGRLAQIDPARGAVVHRQTIGASPQAITLIGDTVYVAVQASAANHRGGTLTVAISNPPGIYGPPFPRLLDPSAGYSAWELLTMTNDGLVGYARSGGADGYRVVPDLAAALPTVSDGGLTYTFQLRTGIRWSTGAEVRPEDIRAGIERALQESHGEDSAVDISGIAGAKACIATPKDCDLGRGIVTTPGSNTITFRLTAPDPDFVYQLALPTFDAVPAGTPLTARLPLPATGPYRIATYDARRGVIRLVRNPRFRVWSASAQPDGYPDMIVERYRYSGANAIRAVEHGAADINADGPDQTWPPALAATLQTRFSGRLYTGPGLVTLGLWLNTRVAPFDDERVRQALNYAVDRNRLVAINGGSVEALVSCQILQPGLEGYQPYCPYTMAPNTHGTYTGPDLAKARRLVAASGTKGQPITIWFFDIPVGRANGRYFVSVLRSLGYRAGLKVVAHNGQGTWRVGRQAGVGGWGGDYPSPDDVIAPAFTCSSYQADPQLNFNAAGFCDPKVDAQIAQARELQASDPVAASRLWTRIDREITDAAPWVPMKVAESADFVSRRLGDYKFCWLSAQTGFTSACLDQLWVR
jgi:peptide/nickel transport system substrate-binding protein